MHRATGIGGYFAKRGSIFERSQSENDDPRVVVTMRWNRHVSQRPNLPMALTLHSVK